MAKKPFRRAFPSAERPSMPAEDITYHHDERVGGVFGFFRDFGVRETIESIIIAVVLALMFRAYEAEAFIIPTGSMAPSLQGQHADLECQNCNFRYRVGVSGGSDAPVKQQPLESTFCPICQYETKLSANEPDHAVNSGDRILVNKFIYDFQEPERYDVIVFKNPNNGKQNYIKRLIGLPGENILIENGDVYVMPKQDDGTYAKQITRKPPDKLRNTLQIVDDTNHIGKRLSEVDWPSRWQTFSGPDKWEIQTSDGHPNFYSPDAGGNSWIRYRHFQPSKNEWTQIDGDGIAPGRYRNGNLPLGQLICDQYAYNDGNYRNDNRGTQNFGAHWVGDLGVHAWVEVKSATGQVKFDLVEGGAHFTCSIDIATGVAALLCDDSSVDTKVTFRDATGQTVDSPTAQTSLKGAGEYQVLYVNADDRIYLWVDDTLVEFNAPQYTRTGIPVPTYSSEDPGDAEPVGVGVVDADVRLTRLQILRDLYYTSTRNRDEIQNETAFSFNTIKQAQVSPKRWSEPEIQDVFKSKKGQTEPMFELLTGEQQNLTSNQDQFLPMGDNSPQSLDGRVWDGDRWVERDMLIGRALFIYWPHTLNKPIPFLPNFGRMGFIR